MNSQDLEDLLNSTLSKENILIRRLLEENLALRKKNAEYKHQNEMAVINSWANSPTKIKLEEGMANKVYVMRKKIDMQKRYLEVAVTFSILLLLIMLASGLQFSEFNIFAYLLSLL